MAKINVVTATIDELRHVLPGWRAAATRSTNSQESRDLNALRVKVALKRFPELAASNSGSTTAARKASESAELLAMLASLDNAA